MSPTLENLSERQCEDMKQFRKNLSDVLPPNYPDFWILRWLKAHNYNLEKTEFMFRSAMLCRELYRPHTDMDKYVKPEVMQKYEFTNTIGHAKNGTPIRYTHFGAGDMLGILMSLDGYEISYYCSSLVSRDLEQMEKYRKETGKEAYEITYIVDMDEFSLGQVLHKCIVETALDLLQAMQDIYPEVFGDIFIVNAPSYFDIVFNVFKPILRLNMLNRIRMASREATPALLLKYIDKDVIPQFLGGTRTDSSGDPRCSEFMKFGGKVPTEYYLCGKTSLVPSDPDVTSMWISPRSIFNYSVVVRKPHSKIHIEIQSENGSIGLKMQFRDLGENPDDVELPPSDMDLDEKKPACNVKYVSPPLKLQAHYSPVDQIVNAPWPGIYIFRFDNTFGWFTSRRIIFRIRLLENS